MIRFINPILPPPEAWQPYLKPAYDSARFTNFGPVYKKFAEALSIKYGGDRIAVPVSSATSGLSATLMAMKLEGAVVIPSFTFSATAHAVLQAGCRPVFCDIDPITWELSPSALERHLESGSVCAVMPVRSYGFAQDLSPLEKICTHYKIPMIVDSAAALGGVLSSGQSVGIQGLAEVFSLHATKVFGIGEGGVVFCKPHLAEKIKKVVNFGFEGDDVRFRGMNGKISEFSAAIGLALLRQIDQYVENRNQYNQQYRAFLRSFQDKGLIELPNQPGYSPFQVFPIKLSKKNKPADVMEKAHQRGLELRRYYFPALHKTRYFKNYIGEHINLPVTDELSDSVLCLPVYSEMSLALIRQIVEIIGEIL
ncbi:MAG: DegT/DnrJ/EryC1/StrS family aminotransferase [Nitrospiria bacterium]